METLRRWASQTSLSIRAKPEVEGAPKREPVHLPNEIMLEILEYLPLTRPKTTQKALYNVCLVNSEWYHAAVSRLYYQPYVTGKNFDLFVRTLCPSLNAHIRKSDLASLVHVLDLSRLVHHSNKATTARLLGRTKPNLTWFKAPASSFGLNCFAALSKCSKLEILDLSLVNDAISMYSLSHSLKKLQHLRKLSLPRSSMKLEDFDTSKMFFPSFLDDLTLQGGLNDAFLEGIVKSFDPLVKDKLSLAITHCPQVTSHGIYGLIFPIGDRIQRLKIANIPSIGTSRSLMYLDGILELCSQLEELSISIDYVSWSLLLRAPDDLWDNMTNMNMLYNATVRESEEKKRAGSLEEPYPLRSLELTSSGSLNLKPETMIRARVILDAMRFGRLSNLRTVAVSSKCGWHEAFLQHETRQLVTYLDQKVAEDEANGMMYGEDLELGMYSFDEW